MSGDRVLPRRHHSALVSTDASVEECLSPLGRRTEILQNAVVRGAVGAGTRICSHVYVDKGAAIGRDCKIKNGALIYDGVVIGDEVFVGPGAVFTNDRHPSASNEGGERERPLTLVNKGATVGANATVLPGVRIGQYATVGAGAVVTRDVPYGATVVGNPARILRREDRTGRVTRYIHESTVVAAVVVVALTLIVLSVFNLWQIIL